MNAGGWLVDRFWILPYNRNHYEREHVHLPMVVEPLVERAPAAACSRIDNLSRNQRP